MHTALSSPPFGYLGTSSGLGFWVVLATVVAAIVLIVIAVFVSIAVANRFNERIANGGSASVGKALLIFAAVGATAVAIMIALIFVVTVPVVSHENTAEAHTTSVWHAKVKAWAATVYGVSAGTDELERQTRWGGYVYSGPVIAQGKIVNVVLRFIDDEPILVKESDELAELPRLATPAAVQLPTL